MLRRFYPIGKEEPYYDLTAQGQKALEWLLELRPQSYMAFIGTESRMITVFDILRQIIEGTEQVPEQRIAALEFFKRLDLQLLIVTPLLKIHTIEPFITHVGFVNYNDITHNSQLRNLSISEYREERSQREVVNYGNVD